MNSRQFCLAVNTYLELAQEDYTFLQKGNQLFFKKSLLKCYRHFQENSKSILLVGAQQKLFEEKMEEKKDKKTLSFESGAKRDPRFEEKNWQNFVNQTKNLEKSKNLPATESEIWFLSKQNLALAEIDLRCGSFLMKNKTFPAQQFASQAVFCFQQAAEKSIKALWLLNKQNATNLLNSTRNSREEFFYYNSHDLVLLAKGLKRGNFQFFEVNII